MAGNYAPRVYRSFEEFEREELRRGSTFRASVDEMLGDMFSEELDFESEEAGYGSRRRYAAQESLFDE